MHFFNVSYDFKISLRELNQLRVINSDTAGRRTHAGGGIQCHLTSNL